MSHVQVKLNEWLSGGFELYKQHIAVLILPALLVVVVSMATFGILAGPMLAGFTMIVLRLKDGTEPKPGPADVFNGFSFFLPSFLFMLVYMIASVLVPVVLGVIPLIGGVLGLFATFAISAFVLFTMFLIVDQKLAFWPAVMASVDKVKLDFWPFLGFTVIISVISSLGMIACFIGVFVTMPFYYCASVLAYRDVFGGGAEAPVDLQPEQPTAEDSQGGSEPPSIPSA